MLAGQAPITLQWDSTGRDAFSNPGRHPARLSYTPGTERYYSHGIWPPRDVSLLRERDSNFSVARELDISVESTFVVQSRLCAHGIPHSSRDYPESRSKQRDLWLASTAFWCIRRRRTPYIHVIRNVTQFRSLLSFRGTRLCGNRILEYVRDAFMWERIDTFPWRGSGIFKFVREPNFTWDHRITLNPAQNRGKNPAEGLEI